MHVQIHLVMILTAAGALGITVANSGLTPYRYGHFHDICMYLKQILKGRGHVEAQSILIRGKQILN